MAERIELDIVRDEVRKLLKDSDSISQIIKILDGDMEQVSNVNPDAQRALGGNVGSIQRKWKSFNESYNNFNNTIRALSEKLEGNTGSVNANSEAMQAEMETNATQEA